MLNNVDQTNESSKDLPYARFVSSDPMNRYHLGVTYSSRPQTVAYLGWDAVDWDSDLSSSLTVGVSDSYRAIRKYLFQVLSDYRKLTAQDWSRKLSIGASRQYLPLLEYEELAGELDMSLAAIEARQVLSDPNEEPVPWEQVKRDSKL